MDRHPPEHYDDFSLCIKTVKDILKQFNDGQLYPAELSKDDRPIVIVWYITGVIENGGFRYLFESKLPGDPDYKYTLEAFIHVGCLEAVNVIKEALCLFPDCKPPHDDNLRINHYLKSSKVVRESLDCRFITLIDNCRVRLADYIRRTKHDSYNGY